MQSFANASSTRLEPIRQLRLAENVAVNMPIEIKGGQILIGIKNT